MYINNLNEELRERVLKVYRKISGRFVFKKSLIMRYSSPYSSKIKFIDMMDGRNIIDDMSDTWKDIEVRASTESILNLVNYIVYKSDIDEIIGAMRKLGIYMPIELTIFFNKEKYKVNSINFKTRTIVLDRYHVPISIQFLEEIEIRRIYADYLENSEGRMMKFEEIKVKKNDVIKQ